MNKAITSEEHVVCLPLNLASDHDSELTIDFQNQAMQVHLPSAETLQTWVSLVLDTEQRAGDIAVSFVDDALSQNLNSRYRSKDRPTNVLSFPAEIPPGLPPNMAAEVGLGDLVLCVPVLLEEAQQQDKSAIDHCAHLVIHGVLHLLGYDHIEDADAEQMEAKERALLAQLGVSDPYATEC